MIAGALRVGSPAGGWSQERVFLLLATLAVGLFVLYPLLGSLRIVDGAEIVRLFDPRYWTPLRNSLLLVALTIPVATVIGVPLAWLCTRTNLPMRGFIAALVSTLFVMPILLTAIAYVFLFGPNSGLVNVAFREIMGGKPLYNMFSFSGIVAVAVFQSFPLVFLSTAAGLANMNPELEESARVAGLSPYQVFRRVTVGVVAPSIMAGVMFAVAVTLTMVSGPMVLGTPVGIPFLTTEIYSSLTLRPNLGRAFAAALPLVAITLLGLWIQSRMVGNTEGRFVTIGGKGGRSQIVDLGRWRWPVFVLATVPVLVAFLLPLGALVVAALMEHWWKGLTAANLGFGNFRYVFTHATPLAAMKNTLILSLGVAGSLTLLAAMFAALAAAPRTPLKQALRGIVAIPLGLPAVVAGLLIMLAWYGRPFQLGGTLWILAFGYAFAMLPYAFQSSEAAYGQVDRTLVEAARVAGCALFRSWRIVLMPLMRNGLFATFAMVFLFIVKEFPLTLLTYSVNTQTIMVHLYFVYDEGKFEKAGALAIVVLAMSFVVLVVAGRLFRLPVRQFAS